MFGIILLSVGTLMHIYVIWRASSVPFLRRHFSRRVLVGIGIILWGAFLSARVIGHGGTGILAATLEIFGMTWMAALFLACVSLLAVDLLTGFGFFFPRLTSSLRGWALVVSGALCVVALVQGLRPPVVEKYEVHIAGLPKEMDGMVLVGMSDLHLGSLLGKQWLEERVVQVRALRPDLVVLLGDLFEGHGQPQAEFLPVLRRFSAPHGVWAVPGNHESHSGEEMSMPLFGGGNIQLLRNRWAEVRPGLVLVGVDDLTASRRPDQEGDFITQAFADRPRGITIFLSHTPWQAEKAANLGARLMLCGHTHGGQVWPFGYLSRLVYPLLDGKHEVDGMTVIVCRGTGTWGPRMRLWRPGEILLVTLRGDKR
jgi:uncharacterized protein